MAQLASDNFVRANSTALGSPWVVITNYTEDMQIVSDTCQPGNILNDEADYYSGVSWPNDQYAEVTFGSLVPTDDQHHGFGVALRASGSAQSMYRVTGCAAGYEIFRLVGGTGSTLASDVTTTFAAGDKLTAQIIGSTLTAFKNGTAFVNVTDTSLTSGNAGIAWSGSLDNASVTLWAGGSASTAQLAGNAIAASTAVGALTQWATIQLVSSPSFYSGVGGILDPNFWLDSKPTQTTLVYYDPTYLRPQPNGELNGTTNNFKAVVGFFDSGGMWASGVVVFTPTFVGYVDVATMGSGRLNASGSLSGSALSATKATGMLGFSRSPLAGNAVSATVATGTLLGSIVKLAGSAVSVTFATGALTAPGPLVPPFNPLVTEISQFAQ